MRKRIVLILFVLLSVVGSAQTTVNLGKLRFRLSKRDFVDTIPIVIDRLQQILIPVMLDDGEQRYFKLDTGSGFGTIYEGSGILPQRMLGQVRSIDGVGRQTHLRMATLPPFSIGSLRITDYAMTEAPSSVLSSTFGHDAVIGFRLFSQGLSAKIDVAARQLILTDRKDFFAKEAGERLRYQLVHHAPQVRMSPVSGVMLNTLFDTGCAGLYLLGKQDFKKNEMALGAAVTDWAHGRIAIANHGVEREDTVFFMQLKRLQCGNTLFTDVETRTHQGATSLGRHVLQYGAMIIDSRRRYLTFQPYSGHRSIPSAEHQTDIFYVPQAHHASVGLIRSSSPFYEVGLRQGDVVLSVNGLDVDFFSFVNYPWIKGVRYTLQVCDRDGVLRQVEMSR